MEARSSIESVVIYRDAALVTRRADCDLLAAAAGPDDQDARRRVLVPGLPLCLEPGSLRARLAEDTPAGLQVLDVRLRLDVSLLDARDTPAEARELTAARDHLTRLELEQQRLARESAELEALRPMAPQQRRGEAPPAPDPAGPLALADFVDAELVGRQARRRELDLALADARQELELREQRLLEASSATRLEHARLSRCAVVTLSGDPDPRRPLALWLEYQVPGARWSPSYELRLDPGGGSGTLRLRAAVAQRSGEDWRGVRLSLATAFLQRRCDLPELRALKLGRQQPDPPRPGWREPPPGLDELFASYDQALATRPPARASARLEREQTPAPEPAPRPRRPAPERTKKSRSPAPPPSVPLLQASLGGAMPMPPPAPPRMAAKSAARAMKEERDADGFAREECDELAASPPAEAFLADADAAPPEEPPPGLEPLAALLDYQQLALGPWDQAQRGQLRPSQDAELQPAATLLVTAATVRVEVQLVAALVARSQREARALRDLPLPAQHQPVESVQSFDYCYRAAAPVDVPATGAWQVLPIDACQVELRPQYVCVPAVEPKVYRTLQVANRGPQALLPGPVDVLLGDELLLTSRLPAIAPGDDQARLGLGVEEALTVARRTRYEETSGGFIGKAALLQHGVEITLHNRLGSPAAIEVRERVPVPADDEQELTIEEGAVTPAWRPIVEPLDGTVVPGARAWTVTVPPGAEQTLRASYTIRLPGERTLVGGNRRL